MKDIAIFIFKSQLSATKRQAIEYLYNNDSDKFKFIAIVPSDLTEVIHSQLAGSFSQVHGVTMDKCSETKLHTFPYQELRETVKSEQERLQDQQKLYLIGVDEVTLLDVAQIRDDLGLFGHGSDILEKFRDKNIMLSVAEAHHIPCPKNALLDFDKYNADRHAYYEEIKQQFDVPFLLKPIDAAGCIGIIKITSSEEFTSSAEHLKGQNYSVNSYVSGKQYHCESIVSDDEFVFEKGSELRYPAIEFVTQGKPLASIPLPVSDPIREKLLAHNRKVVKAFGVNNMTTTCEFFLTESGEFMLIEINARLAGEPQTYTYFKETGVWMDYIDFLVQTNRPIPKKEGQFKVHSNTHSSWVFLPNKKGVLQSKELPLLKSSLETKWNVNADGNITYPESIYDYFLQIILTSHQLADIYADLQTLENFKFINDEEVQE